MKTVVFWIKSSRGTDSRQAFLIPSDMSKGDTKERLESWCSGFGAWEASENAISYGHKEYPFTNRKTLLKRYHEVCKRKNKIVDEWKTLAALLNPIKLKSSV